MDAPAFGCLLALKPDVLEIVGIPQRIEVAFQGSCVVNVAGTGENPGANGLGGNTPVAVNHNLRNKVLLAQTY